MANKTITVKLNNDYTTQINSFQEIYSIANKISTITIRIVPKDGTLNTILQNITADNLSRFAILEDGTQTAVYDEYNLDTAETNINEYESVLNIRLSKEIKEAEEV